MKMVSLQSLVSKVSQSAGENKYPVLSITAGVGFVNQAEKFGKEIAGAQYAHYTVLKKGDFSYNKGNSNTYPQGCIYRQDDYEYAAVPNVFNSFRFISPNCDTTYYKHLFESGYLNRQLSQMINSGVRNDGLLNIYEDDFYSCNVPCPPFEEQKRIAEILECCDKVIRLKRELIEEKKKQKKSLMQRLMRLWTSNYRNESLGQNITLVSGVDFTPSYYNEINDGTPYITGASNIEGKSIVINRWTRFPRNIAVQNDIILVCKGAGVGTIAKMNYPKAHIARQLMAIRGGDKMKTDYIYYFLEDSIHEIKKKSKGLIEGIDRKAILELKINVPPIPYQEKTIRILSSVDHELDLLEQDLSLWELKKKSLMQLLLTGAISTIK